MINRVLVLLSVAVFSAILCANEQSSTASDDNEEVFRIGGEVTAPRLVHRVEPVPPTGSKRFRLNGRVIIAVIISSKGLPRDVRVLESLGEDLDQSAIEAVRQWKFEPARKGEKPVAVRVTVEIRFRDM